MKTLRDKLSSYTWYRVLSFVCIPLYSVFCLCVVEYLNYRDVSDILYMWRTGVGKLWFALIVFAFLTVITLLITRKLWVFAVTLGSFTSIMALINCVKLAVNGDYFFPWDFTMAGNLGTLISFARFDIPWLFFIALPLLAVACVLFWFADTEIPVRWFIRLPLVAVVLVPIILLYNQPKTTEKMLNKFGMTFNDSILQSSNYIANGFTNAFTINCFALKVVEPEGYTEQNIINYLSDYDTTTSEYGVNPDVIVILSEAFFDIRDLKNTEFSQNPLPNYDEISSRDNALTGKLYTTALGGGTVRTEFEMLTGLTVDYLVNGTSPYLYITKDIDSYVSNYKSQGYKTTGIHTYDGKFYMRNEAYPFLGFDEFISQDEVIENYDTTYRRGYITDDTFMDVVIDTLENNTDTPNFIFGITMENHQAYKKSDPADIIIDVKNDNIEQTVLDSVTTYTQGAYYADRSLKKLVDYIDNRERPTVLLFFGDHLPTLGPNQAAYKQAGNIDESDGYDTDELAYLYSTPYLLYSNNGYDFDEFKQVGSHVSTYHMLSLLAKSTDTKMTPYMNYLADNCKTLPYYNVRLRLPLDEHGTDFINSMKLITYDRVKGGNYSVKE